MWTSGQMPVARKYAPWASASPRREFDATRIQVQ